VGVFFPTRQKQSLSENRAELGNLTVFWKNSTAQCGRKRLQTGVGSEGSHIHVGGREATKAAKLTGGDLAAPPSSGHFIPNFAIVQHDACRIFTRLSTHCDTLYYPCAPKKFYAAFDDEIPVFCF
jgi:hypothetical protein